MILELDIGNTRCKWRLVGAQVPAARDGACAVDELAAVLAALPERIKSQMAELVGDPSYFTSGDLEPVRKLARQLARSSGLGSASSDSFFQLMNDLGVSPSCSDSVRRAVLSVR